MRNKRVTDAREEIIVTLREQLNKLRNRLHNLEEIAAQEKNQALIGKCYVSRGTYDLPTTELLREPRVFFRVDAVDGTRVTYFSFCIDKDGKVVIEPKFVSSVHFANAYPQVTKRKFMKELGKARALVLKMTYGVPVVKL